MMELAAQATSETDKYCTSRNQVANESVEAKRESDHHLKVMEEANKAYQERDFDKVISILEKHLPIASETSEVQGLLMLGQSYYGQQRFELALKTFSTYLEKKSKTSAESKTLSTDVDNDTLIIANLYAHHGNLAKAEQLIGQSLAKLDPDCRDYRMAQTRLAWIYTENQSFEKVEELLKSMLKRNEARHGPLDPITVSLRNELAAVLLRTNRKTEAESMYTEVVDQAEKSDDESDLANALSHLADYYVLADQPAAAEAPLQRALGMRKAQKPGNTLLGENLENLQIVYEMAGTKEKIVSLFDECATEIETPELWKMRAVIFARAGLLDKAETELLKLQSQLLKDPQSSGLTNVQYCLGQIYVLDGKLTDALPLFEKVANSFQTGLLVTKVEMLPLEDRERLMHANDDIWGLRRDLESSPNTCDFLGALYCRLRQFEKAENLYKLEIPKKRQTNRSDVLRYLNVLAWIYQQEGKCEAAISSLKEAIDLTREHPEQGMGEGITLRANLALALTKADDQKVAEAMVAETIANLNGNYNIYFSDPAPELGDTEEDYGRGQPEYAYHAPGCYRNANHAMRIEPHIGHSAPPLVLYRSGRLGVQDYCLYPNEPPRKGYIDWNQPPQLTFLEWVFRLWGGRGDELKPLAELRLADLYAESDNQKAEVHYDKALKDAEVETCRKETLAAVLEHKSIFLRKKGRIREAESLELRAKEVLRTLHAQRLDHRLIGW